MREEEKVNSGKWSYADWRSRLCEKYGATWDDAKRISQYVFDRHIDKFEDILNRMLDEKRLYRRISFRSKVAEWWDSVYSDSLLEDFVFWVSIRWERWVKDPVFEHRMRRQRARRGFCDRDVWNLDVWLTTVLPDALDELARITHGYPSIAEPLSKGEDPETYKYGEGNTEEDFERYHAWWNSHLREIAFRLRESNEDTCSEKNEFELITRHHNEDVDEFPFGVRWVDDLTDEEHAANRRYFDRQREIYYYRNEQYRKAMEMLSELHGVLWD